MDDYEIVISNITSATDKVDELVKASRQLQSTNEKMSIILSEINEYWSIEQGDAENFSLELEKCVKRVNTICSCDNELAEAVSDYISGFSNKKDKIV